MNNRKIESDFQLDKLFEIDIMDEISDEESDEIFYELVYSVGWMMMVFNSLDGLISHCMDKGLDPQERRSEINYLLISEMSYSQKVNFVIRNFGLLIYNDARFEDMKDDLEKLEQNLKQSGTLRNRYAHADFGIILKGHYIKVKTKPKRNGVFHDYMRFEKGDLEADIKFVGQTRDSLEEFEEKFWNRIFSS